MIFTDNRRTCTLDWKRQGPQHDLDRPHLVIGDDPDLEAAMRATPPTGTFGRPAQPAEARVWLCSDRESLVSGASMLVDGAGVCR
jgi:hypothetical protein